jgi:CubicO group peptidase (beta-lactamase class C family)
LLSTGVASATPGPSPSGRVPADLRPGGAFDQRLTQLAAEDRLSGSVLLSRRGQTILARSYGMANKRSGVPNRSDTAFALASVSKLFTATAIVQLAQQGRIQFGEYVGTYLDGFPADIADTVTVHHLLTHTSGMDNFQKSDEFRANVGSWTSGAAMLDGIMGIVRRTDLLFTPGTRFNYANSGYVTLGAIVQAVSGRSYYDHIREHVLAAAGMTRSAFYTRPQRLTDDRIAHPYTLLPSGERVDVLERPDLFGAPFIGEPAGDAFATAPDMVRFAQALSGSRLLDSAHTALMLSGKQPLPRSPGTPAGASPPLQAYGPSAGIVNGQRIVGHGGGTMGESTGIEIHLDSGWVVVILCNYGDPDVTPPAQELMGLARQIITA